MVYKPSIDEVLVDDCDRDLLEHRWYTQKDTRTYYVVRSVAKPGGGRTTQRLHRVILSRMLGRELLRHEKVDHIDGNGLDNRRSNLRPATKAQNAQNKRPQVGCTSRYKGVSWHKQRQKWCARIGLNGKLKHLGLFKCELEAARAYNAATIELFGDFARPNVISLPTSS